MHRLALALSIVLLTGCGGGEKPPLATPAATLAPAADTSAPVPERSLARAIAEYQRLGFFVGERPEAAAQRIARRHRSEWGEELVLRTRLDELELLRYDRRRVWFDDIERDVLPGNDEYVTTFREWSRISGGAFVPADVREHWTSEDGPVRITFRLGGLPRELRAENETDFLDLCVLTAGINRLIARSGRQFALYRPDEDLGQDAFVVALTRSERAALERLGWQFATPEQVRWVFAYGQSTETGTQQPCR